MNNKKKAINLFKYIKELYAQRYHVITDVRKQQWYRFINDIPNDNENVKLNFLDQEDENNIIDNELDSDVILKIKKPEFETCPPLPDNLAQWIENDWSDYNHTAICKIKVVKNENGKEEEILFASDENRVKSYNDWLNVREPWARRQRTIAKTRKLFNELYNYYIELERDSEIIELVVGQGILSCSINESTKSYHPILTKRVALKFDSHNNILTICDTDANPELNTMLLQEIDYINHSSIKKLKEDLASNFYHPLDRNETPNFLRSLAHSLHADSKYIKDCSTSINSDNKITIFNNPVFFIRKRTGGILKALDEIIKQISETGELSGPILNLIGENVPQVSQIPENLNLSESLAAISGEDKDILLTKEANKEQLEIAKRIENYNAVLVQGPPGTGKTHTIANLMGHFLAQGKNILVTSHTKKALRVVKEKVVPELQNLCVAVLEDNNKDMERSVDGITEYISSHTLLRLEENIGKLKEERNEILNELSDVRTQIYSLKYKEYETITYDDKSYSVSEAAQFVYENQDLSYIPGKVSLNIPLPVSIADLELLYKTNNIISSTEEEELKYNLPNPKELLLPQEFKEILEKKTNYLETIDNILNNIDDNIEIDYTNKLISINGNIVCDSFNLDKASELTKILQKNSNFSYEEWELNAILDGKKGGGFKTVWINLLDLIKETYQYSSEVTPIIIGKEISFGNINLEDAVNILNEIKVHLKKGKKLNSISLLFNSDWKKLLENVTINGSKIEDYDDAVVVSSVLNLKFKREKLNLLWSELISEHQGIDFSEFGEDPEQSCISFVEQIENNLNWYDNTFKKLKEMFIECGFNNNCIKPATQFTDPLQEIEYLTNLLYQTFPLYIQLAKLVFIKLPNIKKVLNGTLEKISGLCSNASICKNIAYAIETENYQDYKTYYEELTFLYEKYYYYSERSRILKCINNHAPEWAKLIEKRVGIHGKDIPPQNIEDAWKWKQFSEIINQITLQPFEELQQKNVSLGSKLRKITAKLAENCAWYHLLTRIESNIGQKQALQGWKLTTKKIGKGTGKTAPKLKREAQKLMAQCQSAVPAWIMPINKALESLDPTKNKFDIVIIDEASQSDISALAIMYLAKKIIIVGDDEQVSPSAVGIDVDKIYNLADMYIKNIIPNSHLYDMKSSLYDIAKTTFPTLMLKEHFRCVPSIIGYSNRLSYDYKIKPLRDDSNLSVKPSTIAYNVSGQRDEKKCNIIEAKNIVALMIACMQQPEYKDMTFGAISLLGDEQAKLINNLAIEKISPKDYEKRRILCGNASHFQGDERDIIFISLVDSNSKDEPLRLVGEGSGKSTKQRYNVAVSRAKNQVWIVHSLDINKDLKTGDMRKDLIEYVTNPSNFIKISPKKTIADLPFENSVAKYLINCGYHIVQDWSIGSYIIDMVAVYKSNKVAIECDGELYHNAERDVRGDMEKQAILERLGWRFIRIRGSEYYSNPEETMKKVINKLSSYKIKPEQSTQIVHSLDNSLTERVISLANQILDEWNKPKN